MSEHTRGIAQAEADARLIAALLQEVSRAAILLEMVADDLEKLGASQKAESVRARAAKARAAAAKARGET